MSPTADLLPNTSRIVATLRRVSSEVVQPVSRTLWRMSAETYPPLRAREFVRTLVVRQPFATKSLVVLTVLANYASLIDEAGVVRGVLYLVAGACVITAICSVANHLMRRAPRYHVIIVAAAFGVLQLATHGVNVVRPKLGLSANPDGLLLLQVAWSAVFVVATMSFGALRSLRKEHLARFAAEVDEERVVAIAKSRKVADFARETSRVLHGAVQTRLTVCSLMIERARESNDEAALGLALMEAVAILQTPVEPVAGQETIGGEVARKVALWDGFCAISVAVDPHLVDAPNAAARDVGRVVEEAISNAVRHGGASNISVNVSVDASGAVSVTVEDDGSGREDGDGNGHGMRKVDHATDNAHRAGVGSAMFDQITGGNWTLTRRNNRTLFHATLPVSLPQ
jgi:signal transduction histidine kinase